MGVVFSLSSQSYIYKCILRSTLYWSSYLKFERDCLDVGSHEVELLYMVPCSDQVLGHDLDSCLDEWRNGGNYEEDALNDSHKLKPQDEPSLTEMPVFATCMYHYNRYQDSSLAEELVEPWYTCM